jgi:hypothetical protein
LKESSYPALLTRACIDSGLSVPRDNNRL